VRRAGGALARLVDVLHAASDADHRERGWEVRRGAWGARRYRLDIAAWLESQRRRAEWTGSVPGPTGWAPGERVDVSRDAGRKGAA